MSVLKADTLQSRSGGATTLTKQDPAKAWAYTNAAGTAINASLGVTSLTDSGTGYQTLNMTNAMTSSNYSTTNGISNEYCSTACYPSTTTAVINLARSTNDSVGWSLTDVAVSYGIYGVLA